MRESFVSTIDIRGQTPYLKSDNKVDLVGLIENKSELRLLIVDGPLRVPSTWS
jgi:hypothetical protein